MHNSESSKWPTNCEMSTFSSPEMHLNHIFGFTSLHWTMQYQRRIQEFALGGRLPSAALPSPPFPLAVKSPTSTTYQLQRNHNQNIEDFSRFLVRGRGPSCFLNGWAQCCSINSTDLNPVLMPPNTHTHTHTHTHPFNGLLSGTTRVSRYQKAKPILI